jgi:hypothetical protein
MTVCYKIEADGPRAGLTCGVAGQVLDAVDEAMMSKTRRAD